jgi:hypothetical protein
MSATDLDSFVKKFHQLLSEGLTALLDLDTHAGNAWVGLRVQLGQVPGHLYQQPVQPFHQQVHKKVESPCRQRRRARRAAAQQDQANAGREIVPVAEEANESVS